MAININWSIDRAQVDWKFQFLGFLRIGILGHVTYSTPTFVCIFLSLVLLWIWRLVELIISCQSSQNITIEWLWHLLRYNFKIELKFSMAWLYCYCAHWLVCPNQHLCPIELYSWPWPGLNQPMMPIWYGETYLIL